jgi:hypothetical protein
MTPETFEPDTLEEPGGLADPLTARTAQCSITDYRTTQNVLHEKREAADERRRPD